MFRWHVKTFRTRDEIASRIGNKSKKLSPSLDNLTGQDEELPKLNRPTMKKLLPICFVAAMWLAGNVSAQTYFAHLDGPSDSTPSPGLGDATVTYDSSLHTLQVHVSFSGLLGPVSVSHIHAPTASPFTGTAGVATPTPTFPGFPSGVTIGTYDHLFDLTLASSWNGNFITANGGTPAGAEAAFASALAAGKAYWNIHTQAYPGGEIRGFLAVPEPSIMALIGCVAAALLVRQSRKSPALAPR